MRPKELRERGAEELESLLKDARDQLFQSRTKNATHQLNDTSTIRRARREIARIHTIINERSPGRDNLPAQSRTNADTDTDGE